MVPTTKDPTRMHGTHDILNRRNGRSANPEAARPFSIIPNADHYVFQSNEADVLREMKALLGGLM